MKKKRIIFFIALLINSWKVFSKDTVVSTGLTTIAEKMVVENYKNSEPETILELLWQNAIENSVDHKSTVYSLEYANSSYKHKSSLYPFSFRTNLNSSFNDIYPDVTWYTSNSTASATVTKQNPLGNSVSGTLSYGISRNILNLFEGVDSENVGYSHSPSFDLSIQQSLNPAFIQENIKNPEIENLKKNIQIAQYSKDSVEVSLCKKVSNYYIQARCALREINKYQAYLDFYELKIGAAQELLKNSKLSVSDVWSIENKRWEYYEKYIQSVNSKESIELALSDLCSDFDFTSQIDCEGILPLSENEYLIYNPEKAKIEIQIEVLKLQNILTKQNSAPVLSLGGTFSENTSADDSFEVNFIEDKTSLNWSFSLGVSFSEFFSPSKKLKEEIFQNNIAIYNEQLKVLDEQSQNQFTNYQKLIETYQKQIEQIKSILQNRRVLFDDYEKLYKRGTCSLLELKEVCLNVTEAECVYDNLCDYLWLYKWQRSQCK